MSLLQAINLTKIYGGARGTASTRALDDVNLTVSGGEFVAIMGPSGSGKTTLLQLLGSIDTPTSGQILLAGEELTRLKGDALACFRRQHLGFIFQEFNLLDSLTLKENIIIPLALASCPPDEIDAKTEALAVRLGITQVLSHYPWQVSGGQKQRAAAARALIHSPSLVLADEPTGSLDSRSAKALMEALADLNEAQMATIVMVTHDPVSASFCRRVLFIKDGRIFTELRRGADRGAFFHQILDVLSTLGGEPLDAAIAGR